MIATASSTALRMPVQAHVLIIGLFVLCALLFVLAFRLLRSQAADSKLLDEQEAEIVLLAAEKADLESRLSFVLNDLRWNAEAAELLASMQAAPPRPGLTRP